MKLYLKLLIVFVLTATISCSENSDKKINSEVANQQITINNLQNIAENIANDANFSQENIELFINALTRFGGNKDSIVGKTVQQIIDEQNKFLKERSVEALKASASRINLFLNHTFTYIGISFDDADANKKINNIVFDLENSSDKEIKKVEGKLQFYSPHGELVRIFNISTATTIPVTSSDEKGIRFSMPFAHDENNQRDKIVRESRELSAVWTPTLIEFSDGTKLVDLVTETEQKQATKAETSN
jgi:hypothetical protein